MDEQLLAALAAQIRAGGGDWNIQGLDRSRELAQLLAANGVTDLGQLGMQRVERQSTRQIGNPNEFAPTAVTTTPWQLTLGDRTLGFLGDVNNDGTISRVGERDVLQGFDPFKQDQNPWGSVGWSATGHGNVTYDAAIGPDGKVQFRPVWGSSSDTGRIRDALAAAATVFIGGGALANAAAGAAGTTGAGLGGSMGGAAMVPTSIVNPAIGEMIGGAVASANGFVPAAGGLLGGGALAGDMGGALAEFGASQLGTGALTETGLAGLGSAIPGAEAALALGGGGLLTAPGATLTALPTIGQLAGVGSGATSAGSGAWETIRNLGSSAVDAIRPAVDAVGGAGNAAAIVGGLLGGVSSGGGQSASSSSQIDPRMAQYIYGTGVGDTNSLLGSAQQWFNQNRSGMNADMQAGLDMRRAALTDPAYGQVFQNMRTAGMGLLGTAPAGNPFTAGQQQAPQGLLGPINRRRIPNPPARGPGSI